MANQLIEFNVAANSTRVVNSTYDFGFLGGVALSFDQSAAYVSAAGRDAVLKVDLNTNAVAVFAGGAASVEVGFGRRNPNSNRTHHRGHKK